MLGLEAPPDVAPRYNIAPTSQIPACRTGSGGGRELVSMRWGLLPAWSKTATTRYRMINARAESLAEKPAFRSVFRRRRCLLPADGFFEWQARAGGKQPWFITMEDGAPFAFAGLWDRWEGPEGECVESCAIVTTAANETMAPIHDRMPVILDAGDFPLWLDPQSTAPDTVSSLLTPYAGPRSLLAYPVSSRVNSPRNDDPRCLEPLTAPP